MASQSNGVTRATELDLALCVVGWMGWWLTAIYVATVCSWHVDAPLKGLMWGDNTVAMAVLASKGPNVLAHCWC